MKPEPDATLSLKSGMDMILTQGSILAVLPIEQWIEDLRRADTLAAIVDPTLYRTWIYDINSEVVPDILRAALAFKQAILAAREKVRADVERKARDAQHAEANRG